MEQNPKLHTLCEASDNRGPDASWPPRGVWAQLVKLFATGWCQESRQKRDVKVRLDLWTATP